MILVYIWLSLAWTLCIHDCYIQNLDAEVFLLNEQLEKLKRNIK